MKVKVWTSANEVADLEEFRKFCEESNVNIKIGFDKSPFAQLDGNADEVLACIDALNHEFGLA